MKQLSARLLGQEGRTTARCGKRERPLLLVKEEEEGGGQGKGILHCNVSERNTRLFTEQDTCLLLVAFLPVL